MLEWILMAAADYGRQGCKRAVRLVGVVERVVYEPGKPFAEVTAKPTARLDRTRHVLLVFSESRTPQASIFKGKGNGRSG